jgi:HAD superfamily hydrolase (TIGR01450 family)
VEDQDVLTTASLTAALLRDRYRGAAVAFYGDHLPFDADGLELVEDRPDVVVLAGAGAWISHDTLSSILRQVRAGADLVAMHRSLFWEAEAGLALDLGALLPGLEQATGTRAHVVGKPSPAFFEQALASKDIGARGALMVGDDIENDVLAAQRLGMTGVLVRTGKYSGDRIEGEPEGPCHVIDSIADLPRLLRGDEAR